MPEGSGKKGKTERHTLASPSDIIQASPNRVPQLWNLPLFFVLVLPMVRAALTLFTVTVSSINLTHCHTLLSVRNGGLCLGSWILWSRRYCMENYVQLLSPSPTLFSHSLLSFLQVLLHLFSLSFSVLTGITCTLSNENTFHVLLFHFSWGQLLIWEPWWSWLPFDP